MSRALVAVALGLGLSAAGCSSMRASVEINAPADKVWASVVSHVKARTDLTLTQQDPSSMLVQFSKGGQVAGVKVNAMGDNLSQLLISSAHTGTQQNAADLVVDAVLRICGEMKVQCARPMS